MTNFDDGLVAWVCPAAVPFPTSDLAVDVCAGRLEAVGCALRGPYLSVGMSLITDDFAENGRELPTVRTKRA
jgi:hypothetical protein